jgi:hypothetical protein
MQPGNSMRCWSDAAALLNSMLSAIGRKNTSWYTWTAITTIARDKDNDGSTRAFRNAAVLQAARIGY